jgi:hypothetical protein
VFIQGYNLALALKTELNLLKLPSAQLIAQIRIRMAFFATNSGKYVAGPRFEKETSRIHVQHPVRLLVIRGPKRVPHKCKSSNRIRTRSLLNMSISSEGSTQLGQELNLGTPEYKSAASRSHTKPTAVQQHQPCQCAV